MSEPLIARVRLTAGEYTVFSVDADVGVAPGALVRDAAGDAIGRILRVEWVDDGFDVVIELDTVAAPLMADPNFGRYDVPRLGDERR